LGDAGANELVDEEADMRPLGVGEMRPLLLPSIAKGGGCSV